MSFWKEMWETLKATLQFWFFLIPAFMLFSLLISPIYTALSIPLLIFVAIAFVYEMLHIKYGRGINPCHSYLTTNALLAMSERCL